MPADRWWKLLLGLAVGSLVAAACSGELSSITSTISTSSTAVVDTAISAPASAIDLCIGVAPSQDTSRSLASSEVVEASGVVASRSQPGVFWLHNDSPDQLQVHAFGSDGAELGTWTVPGEVFDLEDMAIGPGPDPETYYLYLADIGDNLGRRDEVFIHRIPEPVAGGDGSVDDGDVELVRLAYPDGAHDAETLLVAPFDGQVVIVAKESSEAGPGVYGADLDGAWDAGKVVPLTKLGTLDFGDVDGVATGGDISSDGNLIAVRTYTDLAVFTRGEGQSIIEALSWPPCEAPTAAEPQGEAVGFLPGGRGYVTVSEGLHPEVNVFTLD